MAKVMLINYKDEDIWCTHSGLPKEMYFLSFILSANTEKTIGKSLIKQENRYTLFSENKDLIS